MCSDIPVGQKGKPNQISGFDDAIIEPPDNAGLPGGACLPLSP